MKKNLFYIFISIICLFCFVTRASAVTTPFENQEIFLHDWDTELKEGLQTKQILYEDKLYYEYGYITSSIEIDYDNSQLNDKLVKYDITSNIVKEKTLKNTILFNVEIQDDYIYALGIKTSSGIPFIFIYNLNLELVEQYFIDISSSNLEYIIMNNIYGINTFAVEDNNIYIQLNGEVGVFNTDTEQVSEVTDEEIIKKYFPYLLTGSISYDKKDDYEVYSGFIRCDKSTRTCMQENYVYLMKNNEEVWYKEYSEYTGIVNVKIVDNYIVGLGSRYDEDNNKIIEIIVIDMENGEILQKITPDATTNNNYIMLEAGEKSFMVNSVTESTDGNCAIVDSTLSTTLMGEAANSQGCYNLTKEVWYIPLNITTKVIGTGKGKIEAINTARYGEDITFKVTPDNGYILGEVRVTDANGNVVTFTDNTFTMPNADVLIEVTFNLEENSETSDLILTICTLLIISVILITYSNRKKNNLV